MRRVTRPSRGVGGAVVGAGAGGVVPCLVRPVPRGANASSAPVQSVQRVLGRGIEVGYRKLPRHLRPEALGGFELVRA